MVFVPNGPITTNSIVCIGVWFTNTLDNTNDLYILSRIPDAINSIFRFEKVVEFKNGKINTISSAISKVLTFKITGTQTEIVFEEQSPRKGRFLSSTLVDGINFASESEDSDTILPSQNKYQNWNGDNILLSGILYQLQNSKGSLFYNIDLGPGAGIQNSEFDVFIFPIDMYFGCTANTSKNMNKIETSLEVVFCNLTSDENQLQICKNNDKLLSTWTNKSDCKTGKLFNYCPAGRSCDPTCKSPCGIIGAKLENCDWNPNNSQFECVFDERKWWDNPIMAGAVIIVGIIGIIIILFILLRVGKFAYSKI